MAMASTSLKPLRHGQQIGITTAEIGSIFSDEIIEVFGIKDQNYPKFLEHGSQNIDENWDHYAIHIRYYDPVISFCLGVSARHVSICHSCRSG